HEKGHVGSTRVRAVSSSTGRSFSLRTLAQATPFCEPGQLVVTGYGLRERPVQKPSVGARLWPEIWLFTLASYNLGYCGDWRRHSGGKPSRRPPGPRRRSRNEEQFAPTALVRAAASRHEGGLA